MTRKVFQYGIFLMFLLLVVGAFQFNPAFIVKAQQENRSYRLSNLAAEPLVCNGNVVRFEAGIPSDWTVVNNTGGAGLVWTTTADPACKILNLTNGSGEAACADSDATGIPAIPYDTELVSNSIDLSAVGAVVLDVKAYYRDINTNLNDRLEVDVWDGSTWNNELSWDEDHEPEDFTLNLSAYAGLPTVQVRFHYFGNGYDLYAQVDDIALTCVSISDPVIEVDPAALTALQKPDIVSTQSITVTNSGGSPLNWNIVADDSACDSPTDIPWLWVFPDSGTTFPLNSSVVDVSFDSAGLAPGDYTANLCVNSDDPVTPQMQVPVALSVEPSEQLLCNGAAINFEAGIPFGWQVVDNTGGTGLVWATTADPSCEIPNRTNGSGEAACADSDATGSPAIPYDTELVSNPFDFNSVVTATLNVAAYYSDITTSANDRFEVDVWNGSTWTNELSWDEDHEPEDIQLSLTPYSGLSGLKVRFRYFGNGFDWYAQVDDVSLKCLIPIMNVSINGPSAGVVLEPQTFGAAVLPIEVTTPITYYWQVSDMAPITNVGGITDSATFIWDTPGSKTITVTASNAINTITSTHTITITEPIKSIPIMNVSINGPSTGVVLEPQTFGAAVLPIEVTTPITYHWQVSDMAPITNVSGITDSATFIWDAPGSKTITVTASNANNAITSTHTITITEPIKSIYLPLMLKSQSRDNINQISAKTSQGEVSLLIITPIFSLLMCTSLKSFKHKRRNF